MHVGGLVGSAGGRRSCGWWVGGIWVRKINGSGATPSCPVSHDECCLVEIYGCLVSSTHSLTHTHTHTRACVCVSVSRSASKRKGGLSSLSSECLLISFVLTPQLNVSNILQVYCNQIVLYYLYTTAEASIRSITNEFSWLTVVTMWRCRHKHTLDKKKEPPTLSFLCVVNRLKEKLLIFALSLSYLQLVAWTVQE